MAILNSVRSVFDGYGVTTEYVTASAQSLAINGTVSTALTGFTNPVRTGRIRFHTTAVPAGTQFTGIKITGTDGTTTVTLYQDAIARTAAELLDLWWDFVTDLFLTTITVAVTLANAGSAATADFAVAANN